MKNLSKVEKINSALVAIICLMAHAQIANAVSMVADVACNSSLEMSVVGSVRTSQLADWDCQERLLDSVSGFTLTDPYSNPADSTEVDSVAMESAGGEMYEAFIAGERADVVILTPNRALMMSRSIKGNKNSVDWRMGLAVQPVSGATNAWLTGTYTLLRANRESRLVDGINQTNAGLSEIFDPVTLRITFDGISGCSITSYNSWFSYSLSTDPGNAFGQPNGDDYGFHQAVYAGEGYVGSGGVHEDSVRTFTDCEYVLSGDGKLLINYDFNDGENVAHSVENSYFVSADLRYLVSTVDPSADLYRGFELGVRVKNIAGTQDELNDSIVGTYLFNAPTLELQGSTGILTEPNNQHRSDEKVTKCMARGSAALSADVSATPGWNACTWAMTYTCSSRGEEGEIPAITIQHSTAEGSDISAACRYQVAASGSLDLVVNIETAEGQQDVAYSGAIADNGEGLILRGKYTGATMPDPSDTSPPQREIKNVLMLQALVALKYEGDIAADGDGDGLNNLGEFLYSDFVVTTRNDFGKDGTSDILLQASDHTVKVAKMEGNDVVSIENYGSAMANFQQRFGGDVNGDGLQDVILRNSSTGQVLRWLTDAAGYLKGAGQLVNTSTGNNVTALGDFDGDGDDDILTYYAAGGYYNRWLMESGNFAGGNYVAHWATQQQLVGVGDTDKDGDDDIIWRRSDNGWVFIWEMEAGARVAVHTLGSVTTANNHTAVGDIDGDGDADVVFRNSGTGYSVIWELEANGYTSRPLGNWNGAMQLRALGDYDGDGREDELFMSNAAGTDARVKELDISAYGTQTTPSNTLGAYTINPGF